MGSHIFSRLDKALCNTEWKIEYLEVIVRHLLRYQFDHNLFLLCLKSGFVAPFKLGLSDFKLSGYCIRNLGSLYKIIKIL